jgi:hypothetical protein
MTRAEGGGGTSSGRFAHYERVAEVIVDHWAWSLRRRAARVREQAEDLWAEARSERARRAG